MTKYKRIETVGIPIIHSSEHAEVAATMAEAVEKTVSVVARYWNLSIPKGCEVHVLTNFEVFVNQTVPKRLRWLVSLTKPLWRRRAERAFMLSGGWMIPWRGCPSVGVKPPELLAQSKLKLGERLFVRVPNLWEKIQHLTCHELVHACTAHLRLPFWLNEGIAMRAVDHMVGYPTVLKETRSIIQFDESFLSSRSYRRLKPSDYDILIQLYATGYWVTRQLEEKNPSILVDLLKRKRSVREVTRIIGSALRFSPVGGGAS